jgi:peroxiredoxin
VTATAIIVTLVSGSIILQKLRPPQAADGNPQTAAPRPNGHRSGVTHFDLLVKYLADDRRQRDPAAVIEAVSKPNSELRVASQAHGLRGGLAPLFTLVDQHGEGWDLAEHLRHGPVVLVFYRNYACDACVSRLFELSADIELFKSLGAEVAAISDDPAELTQSRSKRFGEFRFPVLCDPGHAVARAFQLGQPAADDEPERFLHGTFVISDSGKITWAQTGDSPFSPDTATLCELVRLDHSRASGTSVTPEESP